MGYFRKKTSNFQGYQRDSMQIFWGLIKNKVEFPRVTKKKILWNFHGSQILALEFPRDQTQFCGTSRGGISRGKVKKEKFWGVFKKVCPQPPAHLFFFLKQSTQPLAVAPRSSLPCQNKNFVNSKSFYEKQKLNFSHVNVLFFTLKLEFKLAKAVFTRNTLYDTIRNQL